MIADIDIWRAANLLIRQRGADAEIEAARLADLMLDRGDKEGQLVWMRSEGTSRGIGQVGQVTEIGRGHKA